MDRIKFGSCQKLRNHEYRYRIIDIVFVTILNTNNSILKEDERTQSETPYRDQGPSEI